MTDKTSTEDTKTDETPSFASMVAQLAKGKTDKRLSEELRNIVAAVAKTSKPGKLAITIHVKPQKNVPGAVVVTDASKATTPVFEQSGSIFYATDEGELVRDDPHQTALY